jgi:signal transduction histidine kinase
MEATLTGKSATHLLCVMNTVKIPTGKEQEDFFLGVIHDITKRKKAEQNLLRAEKLSMTGKIARTIAHEVRNPLTNLRLALDQLRDEIPEEVEDADLYMNIIERNADRIGNLISDLLNSSKPKVLVKKSQSLELQLDNTLKLVKDRIKLKGITLNKEYAGLPDLMIDEEQIRVAFLNLFVNAIEAMKQDQGRLNVRTTRQEDYIMIEVEDNGIGISEEDLKKLFEPFYTSKKEGTGLGLTAVQNILHAHGAEIEVSSVPGKGTNFQIHFPLPNPDIVA